jgi:hypothetical protein
MTPKSAQRAANADHAQVLARRIPHEFITDSEQFCPVCDSNAFGHNVRACAEAWAFSSLGERLCKDGVDPERAYELAFEAASRALKREP